MQHRSKPTTCRWSRWMVRLSLPILSFGLNPPTHPLLPRLCVRSGVCVFCVGWCVCVCVVGVVCVCVCGSACSMLKSSMYGMNTIRILKRVACWEKTFSLPSVFWLNTQVSAGVNGKTLKGIPLSAERDGSLCGYISLGMCCAVVSEVACFSC